MHPTSYVYGGPADPGEPGGIAATQWTSHVDALAGRLRNGGLDPVVLKGGMGVRERAAAFDRLQPADGPLLVVATGPYVGEGFDCPALDTLFLAAPIAFRGRLVQYVGRVLRSAPGKVVVEVHDYHDVHTPVLASSLAKRMPGYRSLGSPTRGVHAELNQGDKQFESAGSSTVVLSGYGGRIGEIDRDQ